MCTYTFPEALSSNQLLDRFLLLFPCTGYNTEDFSEEIVQKIYDQLKIKGDSSSYISDLSLFFEPYKEEYMKYSALIKKEQFPFIDHDYTHSLRVLFWVLVLCKDLHINEAYKRVLIHAALLHDIGRVHDMEDDSHGTRAVSLIKQNEENPLCLSAEDLEKANQLILWHCIDDDDICIEEALLPYIRLFKDADALDRVRIMDLDIDYLRYKESKKYILYVRKILYFLS